MTVDVGGGDGLTTLVRLGFAAADAINRGRGWNESERANIAAAQAAGYSRGAYRGRAAWRDPNGRIVSERYVIQQGRAIRNAASGGGGGGGSPVDTPGVYTAPPVILYPPQPGRDTTAARRRRGGGPGYRPSWWRTRPGWAAYRDCLRSGYDELECREYLGEAFVGPVPAPVKRPRPAPPRTPDVIRGPARVATAARVLARILGPLPYIFWPSRTADDDTVPGPMPERIPQRPKGPQKRPVIVRVPTRPAPYYPQQPRFPDDFNRPDTKPDTVTRPAPGDRPRPGDRPLPKPATRPTPRPKPRPTPAPRTPGWPDLLPYLVPLMQPKPAQRPRARPRVDYRPLTPPQTGPVEYPAPLPLQARPANCPPCERETKKRKKRKCTNPITSRRTYSRDGQRFRTITRKLQCRA
jgi:hypothetical protein